MKRTVPFAPSGTLFAEMIKGRVKFPEKALRRTLIKENRLLSIPVEGGKNALFIEEEPLLSEHGRWREVHLGAWNAAYGKTPYFPYLFPQMESVYRNMDIRLLADFNGELVKVAWQWLEPEVLLPDLERLRIAHPLRFVELTKEFETKVNYNYSIFDALFRLGKDTVFALYNSGFDSVREQ